MLNEAQRLQARAEADEFLLVKDKFQLGHLPTEQSHPETRNMDELVRDDLGQAINVFKKIDINAIETVLAQGRQFDAMKADMRDTLRKGGRIFFYGCGATGRLSLSTGYMWRYMMDNYDDLPKDTKKRFYNHIRSITKGSDLDGLPLKDRIAGLRGRIVDFMTGGDVALVNSIESAEDYPEWAAEHLRDLGFGETDLLIASTEGGETPSVLGALEEAANISDRQQYLTYCNPDHTLENIERSKRAIDDPRITKICLDSGPMALAGSTRLQATTMQQLLAEGALFGLNQKDIEQFRDFTANTDFSFMAPFIEKEAEINRNGDNISYRLDERVANIVFTDVTERNPTFSYPPLKHIFDEHADPSSTYVVIKNTSQGQDAFWTLLRREPDTLETDALKERAGLDTLLRFDFSEAATHRGLQQDKLHLFDISQDNDGKVLFELDGLKHEMDVSTLHPVCQQLFVKMTMNMHSTLFMGKLDRYKGNWMSWVKPSNNKLIDRCVRYIQDMLENEGHGEYSYEDICYALFEERMELGKNEAIVLKVFDRMSKDSDGQTLNGVPVAPGP